MPIFKDQGLMYEVIENMRSMVRVIDDKEQIKYMNKSMREVFGDRTGQKCFSMLERGASCEDCVSMKCIGSRRPESKDVPFGEKCYRIIASPAKITEKLYYSIEIFHDITEQKKLESESAKHYEKLLGDINFAKQIQKKALPENMVYWNSLKIDSSYLPSEDLSGDIFDIIRLDEEKCLFYIADVSGHGVRSSLLTMFLRQVVRGMKAKAADLPALLEELIKSYRELNLDSEQYISVLCGLYNLNTRGLSVINAGHNCLPLVIESSGEGVAIKEIFVKGMPICRLLNSSNHEIKFLQMEKGDRILLYTDGITEAVHSKTGKRFGLEGIYKIIRESNPQDYSTLANRITQQAKTFGGSATHDDMAAVLIEIL
jgi:sigma-B regulation protein RsbU (phosphoserine phosphatase)